LVASRGALAAEGTELAWRVVAAKAAGQPAVAAMGWEAAVMEVAPLVAAVMAVGRSVAVAMGAGWSEAAAMGWAEAATEAAKWAAAAKEAG
jgi:hypothetical protein